MKEENQLSLLELELLNAKIDLANINDRYSEIEEVEELKYLPILENYLKEEIERLYNEYKNLTSNDDKKLKRCK